MKKVILLLLILNNLIITSAFAQSERTLRQIPCIKLGIVMPTLSLETPLFKDASLKFGTFVIPARNGNTGQYDAAPSFFIQPRFYLTASLRRKHNKRTDFFNGGYLSSYTSYTVIKDEGFGITGILYGTQVNFDRKGIGYFDFGLGIGRLFNNTFFNTSFPYLPLLRLDVGIRLL